MKFFRKVKKDWKWLAINVTGLSVALACMLIIILYVSQELSYDRFHSKANRICRITTDSNNGATSIHPARVAGDWPKQVMADFPAIEKMVRLVPFRRAIIKIGDQKFYNERAFSTDSSFFDVFDFKVLTGNTQRAFAQPNRAFISQSMAMKYFGNLNVVGKEISILHQQVPEPKIYVIDGVMEDFPESSHFHADLLTSFTSVEDQTTWAYTYFLLKPGTDVETLRNTIQKKWEADNKSGSPVAILYLQKLTDIHLFSHKTREMEKNGDIRSIILLLSGAIIVLFIALINFMNLNRVQFIASTKSVRVKLINGAAKVRIASEIASESLLVSCLSVLIGLLLTFKLGETLGISVFQPKQLTEVIILSAIFILAIAILSAVPLFTVKIGSSLSIFQPKGRLYSFPLVVQFALAVVAIACTLVLQRQINFITSEHPNASNANMVVISNNPWEAVQRYERLKGELLNHPEINEVTAAMEEPGGDILDNVGFEMEGIEKKEGQTINIFTTDSNFFSTLNIHPIAGTTELGFTSSQQWEADAVELSTQRTSEKPDPQKIAELSKKVGDYRDKYILNESALRLIGIAHPKDAIGKRFRLNFFLPDLFPDGEIIGVVPDFHYTNLHSAEKPLAIAPRKMFNYCFMIGVDPAQRKKAIETIALEWQKINPEFPFQYEYMNDAYQKVYAGEYAQSRVLSLFAIISILISSLGVFAMASFKIQRQEKEIGIRKVNGAQNAEILVMLNREFVKWVLIGFVIATPLAWYAMHRWLESFAYKTELSWWIFALAGVLALGIALLTVSWQSWKAATKNPVEALRYE